MSKIGLICEGGGTKAAYTAGVLECLLNEKVEFPYTVGISAGAMCLTGYVSKQRERIRLTGIDAPTRKQAVGLYAMMHEQQVFGVESTYKFIEENAPLDFEAFMKNPTELEIGLYNIQTGGIEYFGKKDYDAQGKLIKAACSLLMLTKTVKFKDSVYMDGGLIDMISVNRALDAGCDKVVFISTKEENYVRKPAPAWQLKAASLFYPKQKYVREDLEKRHLRYQEQWAKIKELEAQGRAIILRPSCDMGITRYTTDTEKLAKWYDLGVQDTLARLNEIRTFMND